MSITTQDATQYIVRHPEWTDMEYMIRGHFNWNWVNGDQISNMLVHWIDVFNWFSMYKPINVIAYGSRIRKNIGNVYDKFSMHFEYENGVTLDGMVRRIDGCDNGAVSSSTERKAPGTVVTFPSGTGTEK